MVLNNEKHNQRALTTNAQKTIDVVIDECQEIGG